MAVTNYYSVDGLILGEKSTGGNRVDYLSDALGSVTATVNNSAQVVNTYRYKPYGTQLAKTGTGSDPAFTWVGTRGYRQTGKSNSNVYVRARHYDSNSAMWTTKDPLFIILGFNLNRYAYGFANPVVVVDPLGLWPPIKRIDLNDLFAQGMQRGNEYFARGFKRTAKPARKCSPDEEKACLKGNNSNVVDVASCIVQVSTLSYLGLPLGNFEDPTCFLKVKLGKACPKNFKPKKKLPGKVPPAFRHGADCYIHAMGSSGLESVRQGSPDVQGFTQAILECLIKHPPKLPKLKLPKIPGFGGLLDMPYYFDPSIGLGPAPPDVT